jgi:hypothetical protein
MEKNKKFYETAWFRWLTLIFIAPVGIFIMWWKKYYNTFVRIALSIVFGLIFIVELFIYFPQKNVPTNTTIAITSSPITSTKAIASPPTVATTQTNTTVSKSNIAPTTTQANAGSIQQTAVTTATTDTKVDDANIKVYITSKGNDYHLENCSRIAKSKDVQVITLKEAKARGLKPCKVCEPPQ